MRRWLAILLLGLLPAQLGWAALSVYCAHESGAGAEHFGHHEHRHTGDDGDMEKGGLAKGGHADCAGCHGIGSSALPSEFDALYPRYVTSLSIDTPVTWQLAEHLAEPERPKWSRSA